MTRRSPRKKQAADPPRANFSKGLWFVPLGGAGEIGMNLNLFCCDGDWLIVDCGVTFRDERAPGVDVIMPDPVFIEEHRDKIIGMVVTHAHEDHIGAVGYLWPRLRCPVYTTPFAATFLQYKLKEAGIDGDVPVTTIPVGGRHQIGPFDVDLIGLTHSIPEPNALAIRTPHGTIMHTGDWKFDPDPIVGEEADFPALTALGDEGVLAMIGDSTNVFSEGEAGSEAAVRESLVELIGAQTGKVAVACFASNVARLDSICHAAAQADRTVALVGRSLWRIVDTAQRTGYLSTDATFLEAEDASYLPDNKVLYLCTGSQGEARAALARIASGSHRDVSLGPGDTVIFSSRVIPGNEVAIGHLHNALERQGATVITANDAFVHVSGHPARGEVERMYQMIRPRIAVPVHGEHRHLLEHARIAEGCQVPYTAVIENGATVKLTPEGPQTFAPVATGRLALEGDRLVPLTHDVLRERRKMLFEGMVTVVLVLDEDGELVADPLVDVAGLLVPTDLDLLEDDIAVTVERLPKKVRRREDKAIEAAVIPALRRPFRDAGGKKPLTRVHIIRI